MAHAPVSRSKGCRLSRRRFVKLTSASAATMLLPTFVSQAIASTAPPTFRISLAGDLLKSFRAYLDYDSGRCNTLTAYQTSVIVQGVAYEIEINTDHCTRTGSAEQLVVNSDSLYLDELFHVAANVPDHALRVRRS